MDNEYVREWKARGGRVVGYFCSHAPEELLWAADILPVRMRGTGSRETSRADQYLGPFNCSFVRHTLDRILSGELEWLDGVIITNSCDHVRRLFDIIASKKALAFCHYLDVPHLSNSDSRRRLVGELAQLKGRLERGFGRAIAEDDIVAAIRVYNAGRRLLQRASRLRSTDPPRATGSEVLAMAVAAASVPRDRFNALLERRLEELEGGVPERTGATAEPRLLLIGGMLDDPAYLEVIESLGGRIVGDQLCCGSKTFSTEADESIDPLEAIARRMLEHFPCPRMVSGYGIRLEGLASAIRESRADGVICQRLKFCDLWGGETEMLRRSFREEIRVPLLVLERDYLTSGGLGQLRTRAQAFLESLA